MGHSTQPSRANALALRLALVLGLGIVACKPQIGNKCSTSTDCSQTGDRLCDVSQPGGYCTIYNCEPASSNAVLKCPDEAACIAFGADYSSVAGCQDKLGSTPFQRTFCMKRCDNNSDCRSSYICVDPADPALHLGAVDIDGPGKVCTVAYSEGRPMGSSDVCTAYVTDAGAEMPAESAGGAGSTPGSAGTSSGGTSSAGASGADGN